MHAFFFPTTNTRSGVQEERFLVRRTRDSPDQPARIEGGTRASHHHQKACCKLCLSPLPVKSSALQRIVTFPGAGMEIVSRQSPTFQSGPSSPQLLLVTCANASVIKFICWTSAAVGADGVQTVTSHNSTQHNQVQPCTQEEKTAKNAPGSG